MSRFASGVRTGEERTKLLGTIIGLPSGSSRCPVLPAKQTLSRRLGLPLPNGGHFSARLLETDPDLPVLPRLRWSSVRESRNQDDNHGHDVLRPGLAQPVRRGRDLHSVRIRAHLHGGRPSICGPISCGPQRPAPRPVGLGPNGVSLIRTRRPARQRRLRSPNDMSLSVQRRRGAATSTRPSE